MGMTARRAQTTLTLSPLDNRALANLCGPLDANLRQIEAAYDVTIAHRGETFTIAGTQAQSAQAAAALRRFYGYAEKPLSVDDIQLGLVEIATRRSRGAAAPDDDAATARRCSARAAPTCTAARRTRSRTWRPSPRTTSRSASAPRAPARPTSRSPARSTRSSATR